MATQIEPRELDLQEQLVRIREMGANTDRMFEELRRSRGFDEERMIAEIERIKRDAEKTRRETEGMGRKIMFEGMLATAALLGAGAALAKLFFP